MQRKVWRAGLGVQLGENIIVMGLVFGRSKFGLNAGVRASIEDAGIKFNGLCITLDSLVKLFLVEICGSQIAIEGRSVVFQGDCFLVLFDRPIVVTVPVISDAEVVISVGMV